MIKFLLFVFLSISVIADDRPNILVCISDDQSYAHTSANGDPVVKTPGFDRIAKEGIRFTNPFCNAPSCGPSRSALLTGQNIWRLEEAGNIHSTLPAKFKTYTTLLKNAGYSIGYTGKGWGPGKFEVGGWQENPAGTHYKSESLKPPYAGIKNINYAGNFKAFMKQVPEGAPFCFWFGTSEPHRGYEKGSGRKSGKDPAKVIVPAFLPDHDTVRNDILDYLVEIEHSDKQLTKAIKFLESIGKLENTIIVVTSDHGMPFSRAKASLYDTGTRVPLAIRWGKGIKNPGRIYDGFMNLSDLAPTFLQAAGVDVPAMMTGKSLVPVFKDEADEKRSAAYIAMERHDGCREGGKGYPCRAIRTENFLYIINFHPERWPTGDPDKENCSRYIPYGEASSSPTKKLMMNNSEEFKKYYDLCFAKRPAVELYDVKKDPYQINNLADSPDHQEVKAKLDQQLKSYLIETKDPRLTGGRALWDYYPYYGAYNKKNTRKKKWAVAPLPEELKEK